MKSKISILLLAIVTLLVACKGKRNNEELPGSFNNSTADSAAVTDVDTSPVSKLVKTASMQFKVKSVEQTGRQIAELTKNINGLVMRNKISASKERTSQARKSGDSVLQVSTFNTTGEMTVKIPTVKLDDFMSAVAKMSLYVSDRETNITDKSLDYLSARLKLQSRQDLINRQKKGKVIIKNPANVVALTDEMIDQQVGNRQIDDEVKNSIVTLSFYQNNTIFKEIVVNDDPSTYKPPFFKRMVDNFSDGWTLFGEMLLALVNIWMFIAAAIVAWLLIRRYKSNKAAILVKS